MKTENHNGAYIAEAAANLGRLAIAYHEAGDDRRCDEILRIIKRLARVTVRRRR